MGGGSDGSLSSADLPSSGQPVFSAQTHFHAGIRPSLCCNRAGPAFRPVGHPSIGDSREVIEATDDEILEAATDLGMNPAMKGSAAFFGVTIARPHHWPDDSRNSSATPRSRATRSRSKRSALSAVMTAPSQPLPQEGTPHPLTDRIVLGPGHTVFRSYLLR